MIKCKTIHPFGETLVVYSDGTIYRPEKNNKNYDGTPSRYMKGYYPKKTITTHGYEQISITDRNHVTHRIHVHDLVAECFRDNEENYKEVHHIDGNKLNNDYSNLMWCTRQFNMIQMHKFYKKDNVYKCIDCGTQVDREAKRCKSCYNKSRVVKSTFSNEDIERLLFENKGNFTKVSKMFNISDNALRKRCKKIGIPYKSSAYKKQ